MHNFSGKISFLVAFLAFLVGSAANATPQYGWSMNGSTGEIVSGSAKTCESLKIATNKPLYYKCWKEYGTGVFLEDLGSFEVGTQVSFWHPTYGYSGNGTATYRGPQPDKCDPPRYEGPDTSKPAGTQCSRVQCVVGDPSPGGQFEEPIRYFTTSTGATLQAFGSPGTVSLCIDGCIAKPSSNSGTCPSRVHSGDVSYQYCQQAYADTATKCAQNDEPPKQPTYVPPVEPPPPDPGCGQPGQNACPPEPDFDRPTCGQLGLPACYPGGTCGGPGQPACTGGGNGSGPGGTSAPGSTTGTVNPPATAQPPSPTCGVEGKPACATDATCGGTGQPACGYGDGSASPGASGSCGGLNQPSCQIQLNGGLVVSGEGVPTGDGMVGDLSGVEGKNKEGKDIVDAITAESLGLFDWFPRIPTAVCVNPQVPNPTNGTMRDVPICGAVNTFSKLVSAVICVLCLFGMVAQIQTAIRA